jgi:hypothetical protein
MILKRRNTICSILFLVILNISNAQQQTEKPLKGLVQVDDGYLIGLTKYENTIEYYVMDTLRTPISIKKIDATAFFKFTDKTSKFQKSSKKTSKNVFLSDIPKEEKEIEVIGIMMRINNKRYLAFFPYPKK